MRGKKHSKTEETDKAGICGVSAYSVTLRKKFLVKYFFIHYLTGYMFNAIYRKQLNSNWRTCDIDFPNLFYQL